MIFFEREIPLPIYIGESSTQIVYGLRQTSFNEEFSNLFKKHMLKQKYYDFSLDEETKIINEIHRMCPKIESMFDSPYCLYSFYTSDASVNIQEI